MLKRPACPIKPAFFFGTMGDGVVCHEKPGRFGYIVGYLPITGLIGGVRKIADMVWKLKAAL